jgi:anti-sigma regulatory factor (Ser/Thr protein kinase)
MSARRRLRKIGGDLALSGLPDNLSEKLSLMGVDRVFRFYATPKNAFEDFSDQENAETVSMRLPARPEYVTALRHTLSALLKQKGYDPKTVFRVETIADELANNAIEHGTHKQGCFVFYISLAHGRVDLAARNAHPPMDAVEIDALREKFMNPSVDAESIRGRGIALIKMLSDHVNLDVTRDQTTVSVTKYRNSEARQAA